MLGDLCFDFIIADYCSLWQPLYQYQQNESMGLMMAAGKMQGQILSWQVEEDESWCKSDALWAIIHWYWEVYCNLLGWSQESNLPPRSPQRQDCLIWVWRSWIYVSDCNIYLWVEGKKPYLILVPRISMLLWLTFDHITALHLTCRNDPYIFFWKREYLALKTACKEKK